MAAHGPGRLPGIRDSCTGFLQLLLADMHDANMDTGTVTMLALPH